MLLLDSTSFFDGAAQLFKFPMHFLTNTNHDILWFRTLDLSF